MINYYIISIKGKNINRFVKQLIKQKINILNIDYKDKEAVLKVSYADYNKIKALNTVYKINILKINGKRYFIDIYKRYKLSFICFFIMSLMCVFLSNLILYINIDTNNESLKTSILKELKSNNVEIFSFKKSFKRLKKIENSIINKTNIQWISLDQKGVYLNIKVIERIDKEIKEDNTFKDIVALKDGYIKKIDSSSGMIMKNIDDYVKKGEVIISGNIFKNEKVVAQTKASGNVYAEVWYVSKANRSFYYNKLKETKIGKQKLILKILDHELTILSLPKKINFDNTKSLFKSINTELILKKEKTYQVTKDKYTVDELSKILVTKAKNDILKNISKEGYIIEQKVLKKTVKNGRMYIEVFFKTYENIALEKDLSQVKEKDD